MATNPASPGGAEERAPDDFTRIPHQSLGALVERWSAARTRTFLAKDGEADPKDLVTELAYGTRIAHQITAGRWCVVAELLRTGAVDSWAQIGTMIEVTETEARDEFHGWVAAQVALRRRTGTIGLTEADAAELFSLSSAVSW
ncbi:hypothetical protein ACFORH_16175 [Amycolatopsis roodepoortensis]|uniref:Uncharacterized protein n=1 Tax=Amycolatopsis roodepoortensis TaxID=700274 RepID=A0ABR9KZX6_9PSEU|nr:hypothetical protein [Amycolatopsis roodepoortensis]MBE1573893.1 hypothetical protein [Amycolatopsis roodepoortensis]